MTRNRKYVQAATLMIAVLLAVSVAHSNHGAGALVVRKDSVPQPMPSTTPAGWQHAFDGMEDLESLPAWTGRRPGHESLDVLGDLHLAGTTSYDIQHNQTMGRMIGAQQNGNVHVVWTRSTIGVPTRHIYYNRFDPGIGSFVSAGGYEVDSSSRAGFTAIAVEQNSGWVYPVYHEVRFNETIPQAAGAVNGAVGAGWFVSTQPQSLIDESGTMSLIWPKVALGRDSVLHMVSTRSDGSNTFYYSRGVGQWSGGFGNGIDWQDVDIVDGVPVEFQLIDTSVAVSASIAASPYSGRVAIVWNEILRDPLSGEPLPEVSDINVQISEDDGLNWAAPINITNFCGLDANCASQNWQACNGDTLRAWWDNAAAIDPYGNLHVAFTVVSFRYFDELGNVVRAVGNPQSAIWHWDSGTNGMTPIVTAFGEPSIPGGWSDVGTSHRVVCKPSLAVDTMTVGGLYCSYRRAMPDQWSESLYPMGDIYISRSSNLGTTWSVGRNVTATDGGQNAPAGFSLSERDASLAEFAGLSVGGPLLHLFYELDRDAGTSLTGEGVVTENELYYQRVPLDSIPGSPLVPWQGLHVAGLAGACCYTNQSNEVFCEQLTACECAALGGEFRGVGSTGCGPDNDYCPGTTVECLPFRASGNNCCASIDWEDCGIPARDVFFNYTPLETQTVRLSLCDSPESWDTYLSIYRADENGNCSDDLQFACLDNGCADPLHVNQLVTFTGGTTYFIVLSGYDAADCGEYDLTMTDETDYSQPDTVYYDNEVEAAVYVDSVWARVRFTAPGDFELRTAHVKSVFGDGSSNPCNFYVYLDPPAPGGVSAEAQACVPFSSGWGDPVWAKAYLNNVVSIPAGSDFWVVAGPQAYGYPSLSDWKILGASSVSGRSEFSGSGLYGTYAASDYDFMLRVGGVLGLGNPDSLVIHRAENGLNIELSWSPALNASEYAIYRSTSENFQPLPVNLIGTAATTSYVDAGVLLQPNAQYYYIVTALAPAMLSSNGVEREARAPMQVKTQ